MTIPGKAVEWATKVANDPSHGYDQANRWGTDYDCSSLVISAYKAAGVPLSCTFTGNMRSDMLMNGFVTVGIDKASGIGLQPGDVLLNEAHHTAMYVGDGYVNDANYKPLAVYTHPDVIANYVWVVPGDYEPEPTPAALAFAIFSAPIESGI